MDCFLGQIEIFGFSFPPRNWVQCNGQMLSIQQHQALFALLGTTYGGNGVNTFGLPDLRGRVPVGYGRDRLQVQWNLGQKGGEESITLTTSQIPAHDHTLKASSAAAGTSNTAFPGPTVGLGQTSGSDDQGVDMKVNLYVLPDSTKPQPAKLHSSAIGQGGSSQPHENRMPLIALNVCISIAGNFPSRN